MTDFLNVATSAAVGIIVFAMVASVGMRIVRGLELLTHPETEAQESPVVALTDDGPQ